MKTFLIITKDQVKELKEANEEQFIDMMLENGQPWQWAFQDAYEYACELVNN